MEKILTPAELKLIQEFTLEVLTVCNFDDTGVTDDLGELAEVVAEIVNAKPLPIHENEPDLYGEDEPEDWDALA